MFLPRHRKTSEEAAAAVSLALHANGNFPDLDADVLIFNDENTDKDVLWVSRSILLRSTVTCLLCSLLRRFARITFVGPIQCRSVRMMVKDVLPALASADCNEMSLANLKKIYAADTEDLKKSLANLKEIFQLVSKS